MWLIAFDVDGTIVEQPASSWRLIHILTGKVREAEENMKLFREGKISYEEWAILDVKLWRGVKVDELDRKIEKMIRVMPGVDKLFKWLRKNGFKIALISSGVNLVVNRIAKKLEADIVETNIVKVRDGIITGEVEVRVGYYNKGDVLKEVAKRLGVPGNRIIAVGDEENDIPMFKVASISIALNPAKKKLWREAKYTVYTENLENLIPVIAALIAAR